MSDLLNDEIPAWLRDLEPSYRFRVHVCFGKNCTPNGAQAVYDAFRREIDRAGLSSEIELIATSCRSRCELGPSVNVYPGPVTYGQMDPERVREVVRSHLTETGGPVPDFIVTDRDVARAKQRAGSR